MVEQFPRDDVDQFVAVMHINLRPRHAGRDVERPGKDLTARWQAPPCDPGRDVLRVQRVELNRLGACVVGDT